MTEISDIRMCVSVCVPFSAHPKAHALCVFVCDMVKGRGRLSAALLSAALTGDVHMMCVGSVRAVAGSSPIPTGRASKGSFLKRPLLLKRLQ